VRPPRSSAPVPWLPVCPADGARPGSDSTRWLGSRGSARLRQSASEATGIARSAYSVLVHRPGRLAYEIFDSVGAAAFADRARIELRASGGQARERAVETPDTLTAQEALIARLAGEGASNPEIAAQLFISPATVAYHLRKVFTKLGISSRSQLARALPARPGAAPLVAPQGRSPGQTR
jgi:DNA-binding CsgD family transcriptional regulator